MTTSFGMRRFAATMLLGGLAVTALAACGSDDSASDKAAGSSKDGVSQIAVTLVSGTSGDECKLSDTTAKAGPVTFEVTNESATGITEFEILSGEKIIGEKESLAPGLPKATLTLTLGGGDYTIYCPGAVTEKTSFKVTGQASASPTGTAAQLLQQGATDYATYVTTQLDGMVSGVKALQAAVDAGDLAAAQKAYAEARPFYEKIESDVDGFVIEGFDPTDNHGNLDYLVDMRASNLDPAVGWSGFHAVERDLFGAKKITAATKKSAADLTTNVSKLAELSTSLTYKPEDLANGAAGLLEEVQANKISGEEEAFSHIDLVDFAGNVEGAQQAFEALRAGLTEIDATLVDTISKRFDDVNALLETYKDPKALGGYKLYTPELKKTDANKLSQTVQALQDSLSRLAEKVATA
ncbi:iron uptake system protein EfeO [Nocardioides sp. Kera G14]|uniref:iron uptake system protein EfeO n=1 Tax=Nocardioides sp. Kera G14 TaxID=2884264 RepID=UPI001D10B091|nr:iron uptake system protein EfeO [Nocardioides sp. Kera G14]UDY22720.1 EfeM/EfeO family lipoprotein [Nocardioides sp. Kera G14]